MYMCFSFPLFGVAIVLFLCFSTVIGELKIIKNHYARDESATSGEVVFKTSSMQTAIKSRKTYGARAHYHVLVSK